MAEKKVLILELKNLDQNPPFNYLEATITDAVRKSLRKRFQFAEIPESQWRDVAQKHFFIDEKEFYTRNFGMQIGLLTGQDVVIGGHFQAVTRSAGTAKAGEPQQVLELRLFLLDIGNKKILDQISDTWPVDATIFASIDKLAERVSEGARQILPNKNEVQPQEKIVAHLNNFAIHGGLDVLTAGGGISGQLQTGAQLYPADFRSYQVKAEYRRDDVFFRGFQPLVNLSLSTGSKNFQTEKSSSLTPASFTGFAARVGAGYRLQQAGEKWWNALYLLPHLSAGYSVNTVRLNYSALSAKPLDAGSEIPERKISLEAPVVSTGVTIGWQLSQFLALECNGEYALYFYEQNSSRHGLVTAGLAFKL